MRKMLFLLFAVGLLGCNESAKPAEKAERIIATPEKESPPDGQYFLFDEVLHFHSSADEDAVYEEKAPSEANKSLYKLLVESYPDKLPDNSFIGQLDKLGLTEKKLDTVLNPKIAAIFSNRVPRSSKASLCTHFYRDILVFKNHGQVSGIAKICFGCNAKIIFGAHVSTDGFAGYDELEKILQKQASSGGSG